MFGPYRIARLLGRGGMGVVYKARQVNLNRTVAVKTILTGNLADDEAIQRFHTEAEAAANLQHPNIVAIHEVREYEGLHYFSMDFVEGTNLAQAAEYVKKMAAAIHFAHQRGTLHRDLKPSNVLIAAHDEPRITDFGLAKIAGQDGCLTRSGSVLGTPNYMAPEQAAARRPDRLAVGRLFARRDYLRAAHRPPAVQGRLRPGDADEGRQRGAGRAAQDQRRCSRRPRNGLPQVPRRIAIAPLGVRARSRGGPRPLPETRTRFSRGRLA